MKRIFVVLMLLALALPAPGFSAPQDKKDDAAPAAAPASGGGSPEESNPDRKPGLDLFRVLIKPEAPPAPVIQPTVSSAPPPPPPPPPLQFSVKAIAGEAPHYVAVLNYNGQDYIAEEGWESEDHAFVVKRIGPNKAGQIEVEVFNKKANKLAHKSYAEPKIPGFEGGDAAATPAGGTGLDAGTGGDSTAMPAGDASAGGPPPAGPPGGDTGAPPPAPGGDAGGPPPDAGGTGGDAGAGPPPQ